MRFVFCFALSLVLSAALPLAQNEIDSKAIPLHIARSKIPPSGISTKGYKHPWFEYLTADISIGSTMQGFLCDFSTVSSDLTVNFCTEHPPVDPATCFEPLNSTSYKTINDHIGSDFVSFGQYWNVSNQEFPTVSRGINEHGFYCVVGAAWPSLSSYGITPFWISALKDEPKTMFGIFMSHDGARNFLRFGGELLDSECDLSTLNWHSLSSLSYWQLPIEGYKYGNLSRTFRRQAVIDTGSGWIGVPGNYLIEMMNRNNVSFDRSVGAYTIDCRRALALPVLELTINDKKYEIFPSAYVDRRNPLENGMCVVNLKNSRSSAFGAEWTLGFPFLQSYCTSYDYDNKRIGIASNLF